MNICIQIISFFFEMFNNNLPVFAEMYRVAFFPMVDVCKHFAMFYKVNKQHHLYTNHNNRLTIDLNKFEFVLPVARQLPNPQSKYQASTCDIITLNPLSNKS